MLLGWIVMFDGLESAAGSDEDGEWTARQANSQQAQAQQRCRKIPTRVSVQRRTSCSPQNWNCPGPILDLWIEGGRIVGFCLRAAARARHGGAPGAHPPVIGDTSQHACTCPRPRSSGANNGRVGCLGPHPRPRRSQLGLGPSQDLASAH